MHFRRSAQFQWDELRSVNVMFLGAPKMNPPTRDLPIPEDLVCDLAEIRNLRPKAGEQAAYGFSKAEMLGEVAVIGSRVSEGTWAAADFLSRPAYLRTLLSHVAHADGQDVPIEISYLTHHEPGSGR